jgi:hypothetical protein
MSRPFCVDFLHSELTCDGNTSVPELLGTTDARVKRAVAQIITQDLHNVRHALVPGVHLMRISDKSGLLWGSKMQTAHRQRESRQANFVSENFLHQLGYI